MKYNELTDEAKALFDYVCEFWADECRGYEYSEIDYADALHSEKVFESLTNLTIEDIDLN